MKTPKTAWHEARKEVVRKAIVSELDRDEHLVLLLRNYEAFTFEEIAATLEITEAAAKTLLHRAHTKLRRALHRAGLPPEEEEPFETDDPST